LLVAGTGAWSSMRSAAGRLPISESPARSVPPAVLSMRLDHRWLYLVAPIMGAVASVAVCRCVPAPGCCGAVAEGECP
jgi:glycerol uptake facilitator-like aquaporin